MEVSKVEPAKCEKLLLLDFCQVHVAFFLVGRVVGIGPRTMLEQCDRCKKLVRFLGPGTKGKSFFGAFPYVRCPKGLKAFDT